MAKLGGKIKLDMFLIQINKKKYKNCKHLPLEVTKSEFWAFFIENTRWVAVTPLLYILTLTGYPNTLEGATSMVFASKWAQRMNLQLPRSFLRNLSAFQCYREKSEGLTMTPLGRTRVNIKWQIVRVMFYELIMLFIFSYNLIYNLIW